MMVPHILPPATLNFNCCLMIINKGLKLKQVQNRSMAILTGNMYWKHSSPSRRVLGSLLLKAHAVSGRLIIIFHLVLVGSSQCVIGKM